MPDARNSATKIESDCVWCSAVTENTRASYPIHYIANAKIPCVGPHPKNLILLCCDAFGVLPPVSKLTKEQAMYHFISGYTAKVNPTLQRDVTCCHQNLQLWLQCCMAQCFLPVRCSTFSDYHQLVLYC